MPDLFPVPDGLADRLLAAGVEAVPTTAYAWLRSDGSVKYTYGDYEGQEPPRGAPDEWVPEGCVPLYVLRPVPVPTTCNERVMLTVRDYGPCIREKDHDGPHVALCAGREDVGLPAPAPSGETAERTVPGLARAVLSDLWNQGHEASQACATYLELVREQDVASAFAGLASAGLLSSPAQTPEPDAVTRERAEALLVTALRNAHAHGLAQDVPGSPYSAKVHAADLASELAAAGLLAAASPAQTDGPAVHWAALREELWSPWCSGTAGWDAPLTVTAAQVTCPACRAGLVAGERSPAPAQTDAAALQRDVRDLLLALGLSDHARPYSPHEVIRRDVLPEIERLRHPLLTVSPAQTDGEREWAVEYVADDGATSVSYRSDSCEKAEARLATRHLGRERYFPSIDRWRTVAAVRVVSRFVPKPGPWSPVPSSETETPT